jgi:hypothetical protein
MEERLCSTADVAVAGCCNTFEVELALAVESGHKGHDRCRFAELELSSSSEDKF